MSQPLVITVAPNGARRGKADHPALPVTPAEIAREAARCHEAGAAMIHLHVRDSEQRHSLDVGAYREAVAAVREAVGDRLVIQVTSEAVGIFSPEEQMAMIGPYLPAWRVDIKGFSKESYKKVTGLARCSS